MSLEGKIDYDIMKSLNSLLELELQDTLKEEEIKEYKNKSKALLTKLLAKLEDNFEYQKYLETEIKRLEDAAEEQKETAACEEQKESERSLAIQRKLEEKDNAIAQLKQQLFSSEERLQQFTQMREKEMHTVKVVCSALTDRLKSLNVNFQGETTPESPENLL